MKFENLVEAGLLRSDHVKKFAEIQGISPEDELSEETALGVIRGAARSLRRQIAQLEQKIEDCTTDIVTGLPKREQFNEQLNRFHQRFTGDTTNSYTLFVWDLDRLKLVNDSYGHTAGDAYLRQAGSAISSKLRPTDFAARIGGDEFAVITPGVTDEEDARALITRVGHGLFGALDELVEQEVVSGQVRDVLGISGGFAQPTADETAADVLNRADQNMYQVKRSSGR